MSELWIIKLDSILRDFIQSLVVANFISDMLCIEVFFCLDAEHFFFLDAEHDLCAKSDYGPEGRSVPTFRQNHSCALYATK